MTPTDPHPPSRQKHTPEPLTSRQGVAVPHAPEPWRQCTCGRCGLIWSEKADIVAAQAPLGDEEVGYMTEGQRQANAARIVACVNSLAGVDDPASALKAAREALDGYIAAVGNFQKQNRMGTLNQQMTARVGLDMATDQARKALAQLTPKLGAE